MEEAYEAYNKAISLEPSNEGYKQNLKIVEDKLKNSHPSGVGPDMGFGNMGGFMNMFNNPQFINMATQLMSDPQMQNMMSNIMGGMGTTGGAEAAAEPQGIPGMPSGLDFNSLLQAYVSQSILLN
jgi:small glutamine-rich tetratricopeptide repeat-containing protein alpha